MGISSINTGIYKPVLPEQLMDPSRFIEFKLPEDLSSSKWSLTLLRTSKWDLMLFLFATLALCAHFQRHT